MATLLLLGMTSPLYYSSSLMFYKLMYFLCVLFIVKGDSNLR